MSDKVKYINVLATMIQRDARNFKQALNHTETVFNEQCMDVMQLSKEDLAELVVYATMGMHVLEKESENSRFHTVILDDMQNFIHSRTCKNPNCMHRDESVKPADEEGHQNEPKVRGAKLVAAGSLSEVLDQLREVAEAEGKTKQ